MKMKRTLRMTLAVGAAVAALPATALAGAARVEGLVGNPLTARNALFVADDLNVFLNPALVTGHSGLVPLGLGLAQTDGAMAVDPYGGAIVSLSDSFTLGAFLNRAPGQFSDQAALNAVLGQLIGDPRGGGAYVLPDGSGGDTAPELFLPVDLIAAFGNDSFQLGVSVYGAFARTYSVEDAYDDGDVVNRITLTKAGNYVNVGVGGRIVGDQVSPEFWVRYGGAASWSDALIENPDEGDRLSDITQGIQGTNGFSFGARVPIEVDDFIVRPAVSVGLASGRPFYVDRGADSPLEEEWRLRFDAVAATFGVGLEYAPDDDFRLVATLSGEVDSLTTTSEFEDADDRDIYSRSITRQVDVRFPVASIGAEGLLTEHLGIRGSIRAGMLAAAQTLSGAAEDGDGITGTFVGTDSGAAGNSFSAAGGLFFPFDAVRIDITAGGMLVADEESGSFFSRADVIFKLP